MKTTVSRFDFFHAFEQMRPDNFSREGLNVMFDYLEMLEEDTGTEIEFDVIAICGDYNEDDPADIANHYSIDVSECIDEDDVMEVVQEYLMNEGVYIGSTSDSIIYQVL